jgi:hypothetical protein
MRTKIYGRRHHTLRDSNLYPTHGLGPMATYTGVNRGDRFDHLVSMSSSHLGLESYRQEHISRNDPKWKEVYKCGDYNTSIIKTVQGRTIMLQHNVSTPRPYDRINLIQGTKGSGKQSGNEHVSKNWSASVSPALRFLEAAQRLSFGGLPFFCGD